MLCMNYQSNSGEGVLVAKTYLLTALIMSMVISGCQVIHANQGKVNTNSAVIAGADAHTPEHVTGLTEQKQVIASDFIVASANPLATQAGYDILKQGGSAADAMVAVQTTLSLVEPQYVRLGRWCICVVLGQYRQNIDHI